MLAYHAVHLIRTRLAAQGIHKCWASIRESMRTWVRITTRLRQTDGALIVNRQDTRPAAEVVENLLGCGCGTRHPPHEDPPDELTESHKMWGHVGICRENYRVESK